ncbi:hypothetical protein [Bradyrhizobium forestalis]|uniref:hypothetical protein n=1 Tax=Bradyrhizobium forestalis TaxID=1419263 RepID=UPI001FE194AD|nr:hypothetical protein [Bradyrhizobium forestalis]
MKPFAWRAYGLRDLKPYRLSEIEAIEREHDVRRLVAAADQILADDEELSRVDYSAFRHGGSIRLFTESGNSIKGLQPDPAEQLVAAIRHAAKQRSDASRTGVTADPGSSARVQKEVG